MLENKCLMSIVLLSALLVSACTQQQLTGAMEEEELYNTMGLVKSELFDGAGLAPVALASKPFVRVGLMWDAPEDTQLQGRIATIDGAWGPWTTITPLWSEDIFHTSHLDVPGGRGHAFQLRLADGRAPQFLRAEGIERIGHSLPQVKQERPEGRFDTIEQALAPSSLVNSRSAWGARSPACSYGTHTPARITVHHTVTPLPDTVSVKTRLRGIQNYHMDSMGWCDIGYHYLVDWNGEIWQGHYETKIGTHVANNNTTNVGISFMGTYNSTNPTSAQINKVASLVEWLSSTYGIPKTRTYLKGHREYRGNSAGDCPGDRIQARLGDLLSAGSSTTQGRLLGVVYEEKGNGDMSDRVPGAQVRISGGPSTSAAADDAVWSFDLSPGEYTVTVTASGYASSSRTCQVNAGQDSWCSIGLSPQASTGRLLGVIFAEQGDGNMDDRLAGSTVRISGGPSTTSAAGDGMWSFELVVGTYTVNAAAEGYQDNSRTCQVSAGQDSWCSIGLTPQAATGRLLGTVFLDSGDGDMSHRLAGALVSAGGQQVQSRDSDGMWELTLGEGTAQVSASLAGYLNSSRTCMVSADQDTWCSIGLTPEEEDPRTATDPDGTGEPRGLIYGTIHAATKPASSSCQGPLVAGAVVRTGDLVISSDQAGYYQLWLPPGPHELSVSAEGYLPGQVNCPVDDGGTTLCCLTLEPKEQNTDEPERPDLPLARDDDQIIKGGCASAGQSGTGQLAPILLVLLGLLFTRRKY